MLNLSTFILNSDFYSLTDFGNICHLGFKGFKCIYSAIKITVKAQSCYCGIDDFLVVGGRIISKKLFSVIHEAAINYSR